MSYYILRDDQAEGPYSLTRLSEMCASGEITEQTFYCQEGFDEWLPLKKLSHELQNPVAVPPPAPPISEPPGNRAVNSQLQICPARRDWRDCPCLLLRINNVI